MPVKLGSSRYDKPVPEPHFIPGYTGHCPDLHDHVGTTYPWATYVILEEKPHIGMRLSPIKAPKRILRKTETSGPLAADNEDDKIIKERRAAQKHPLLGVDVTIGYGGHVPKEREVHGKTHQHVYRKCIADFERQQRAERSGYPSVGGTEDVGDTKNVCCC